MTTKHGECCYCGRCGELHDDCRCDLDETVEELEQARRDLAAARAEAARLRENWAKVRDEIGSWAKYNDEGLPLRFLAMMAALEDGR